MKRLIEQTKEHFEKIGESPDEYQIVVGYGYDYQEAQMFRDFQYQNPLKDRIYHGVHHLNPYCRVIFCQKFRRCLRRIRDQGGAVLCYV